MIGFSVTHEKGPSPSPYSSMPVEFPPDRTMPDVGTFLRLGGQAHPEF